MRKPHYKTPVTDQASSTHALRHHSRQLIRALGLLEERCFDVDLTPAQAHALIELNEGPMNGVNLAKRLSLNKSNASRVLKQLENLSLLSLTPEKHDQRSLQAKLTPLGIKKLNELNHSYDQFSQSVLAQLTPLETSGLLQSLSTYRTAIDAASAQNGFNIRTIQKKDDQSLAQIIRDVSVEHGLIGEGYGAADSNLNALFNHYRQSGHIYWVVIKEDRCLGGAGVQPLANEPTLAELSKMYLLPEARGLGLARRLACQAIQFSQNEGYTGLYLETTACLKAAFKLYRALGFKQLKAHRGDTGHQLSCEIAMLLAF